MNDAGLDEQFLCTGRCVELNRQGGKREQSAAGKDQNAQPCEFCEPQYQTDHDQEPAEIHGKWWGARIARQQEIDASIAAKAEFDKPTPGVTAATAAAKTATDKATAAATAASGAAHARPHIVIIEDDGARIEETHVGGRVQRITVQSKIGNVRAYEIEVAPPGRDPSQERGNAGRRAWSILNF